MDVLYAQEKVEIKMGYKKLRKGNDCTDYRSISHR